MSSVGSLNLSTLRMTGLASGLDTDSLVKSLLQVDQLKVDKQFKYQTKLQWKGDALRDVNTLLKNFRQDNLSVLNQDTNMLSASSYNTFKVTMLNDTSAVSVTAGSSANVGQATINNITQLAAAAAVKSESVFNGSVTTDMKLSDLDFANDLEFVDGKISFSINGQDFSFGSDTQLSDMLSQVNLSGAGVTMRYSSLTNGFTLTSKDMGSASKIEIVNISGNAFAPENSAFKIAQGTTNGKDAILSIDNHTVTKPNNTFTIDGITYALKNTTSTAVSFNVERDIDSIYNKIVNFVGKYNDLVDTLQSKVNEEVYRTYEPLTDTEREAMSESQAEKWDEKAKNGLLKNDSNINMLLNTMRSAFYSTVSGVGISPSSIGLTTENYSSNGKIVINENALRSALQKNPDQVIGLFTNTSTATDSKTKNAESGLITKISNALLNYTNTATNTTLADLTTEINNADDKMTELKSWLNDQSENYYKKFSVMESAIASLNNQSSWLNSVISSWSNG